MCFASADAAKENGILLLGDEISACKFQNFLLGERRNGSEIIGVEGIGNGKLGLFQQSLTAVDLAKKRYTLPGREES